MPPSVTFTRHHTTVGHFNTSTALADLSTKMSSFAGEPCAPVSSTTASTCTPESGLLSDTQPMFSEDDRTKESTGLSSSQEVTQQPLPPPPTENNSEFEEMFRQLASNLATALPKVPAEKFLKRALILAQRTEVWIKEEARFFERLVDDYTDRALESVTEHKKMEDEVSESTKNILEVSSATISRFEKIKKLTVYLKKTRDARAKIVARKQLLEDLRQSVHRISAFPHEQPVNQVMADAKSIVDADWKKQ